MRSEVQTGECYAMPESINSRTNVPIPLVQLRR